MFSPMQPNISDHGMDEVVDIYKHLKSDTDHDIERKSADMLVTVVPGPPPSNFDHKNVTFVMKHMKKAVVGDPPK